jgi:hypothetical protein
MIERSRHDASDLIVIERQKFQVVQSQEHFVVYFQEFVFG